MVRWVDPTLQTKVTYRAGDTMICVPPKSGTTWTMNIYHQLVSKGEQSGLLETRDPADMLHLGGELAA